MLRIFAVIAVVFSTGCAQMSQKSQSPQRSVSSTGSSLFDEFCTTDQFLLKNARESINMRAKILGVPNLQNQLKQQFLEGQKTVTQISRQLLTKEFSQYLGQIQDFMKGVLDKTKKDFKEQQSLLGRLVESQELTQMMGVAVLSSRIDKVVGGLLSSNPIPLPPSLADFKIMSNYQYSKNRLSIHLINWDTQSASKRQVSEISISIYGSGGPPSLTYFTISDQPKSKVFGDVKYKFYYSLSESLNENFPFEFATDIIFPDDEHNYLGSADSGTYLTIKNACKKAGVVQEDTF